jgi:hypothetical protein
MNYAWAKNLVEARTFHEMKMTPRGYRSNETKWQVGGGWKFRGM